MPGLARSTCTRPLLLPFFLAQCALRAHTSHFASMRNAVESVDHTFGAAGRYRRGDTRSYESAAVSVDRQSLWTRKPSRSDGHVRLHQLSHRAVPHLCPQSGRQEPISRLTDGHRVLRPAPRTLALTSGHSQPTTGTGAEWQAQVSRLIDLRHQPSELERRHSWP